MIPKELLQQQYPGWTILSFSDASLTAKIVSPDGKSKRVVDLIDGKWQTVSG